MTDDRRSSSRHDVDVPCVLSDGVTPGATETRITNMSVGGAFVTHPGLSMGQRVHVSFHMPAMVQAIAIGAVVRWATDQGGGIQFDGLRPKDVWALSKYFDQL